MNKTYLILISILFSISTMYSQSPNILIIIGDDLGVDAMNGYNLGNFKPNTPHLDSIRNNGLTFANAWSSPCNFTVIT